MTGGARATASLPPRRRQRGNAAAQEGWIRDAAALAPDCDSVASAVRSPGSGLIYPRGFSLTDLSDKKKWIGEPAERPSLSLLPLAVRAAFEPTPTCQLFLGITTGIQFSLGKNLFDTVAASNPSFFHH